MSKKPDYNCPKLTVDIIITVEDTELTTREKCDPLDPDIVIIERKNAPKGVALPGGFVDYGEPTWRAAIREAEEETGLAVDIVDMFAVYSNPTRDARVHAVSVVYLAKGFDLPQAGDDAKEASLLDLNSARSDPRLVFDHALILSDFAHYLRHGVRPDWHR